MKNPLEKTKFGFFLNLGNDPLPIATGWFYSQAEAEQHFAAGKNLTLFDFLKIFNVHEL